MDLIIQDQSYRGDIKASIGGERFNLSREKKNFIYEIGFDHYKYNVIEYKHYNGDTFHFEVNDVFGKVLKEYFNSEVDKGKVLCFLMV